MNKSLYIIFSVLFLCCGTSMAGTYYVSPTGAATWANCEDTAGTPGPKEGTSACALATANTNADDDDVVYLRGGKYSYSGVASAVNPSKSGSIGHPITFKAYTGETPIIEGDAVTRNQFGVQITKNYIVIDGIHILNMTQTVSISGSYNEIKNCELYYDYVPTSGTTVYVSIALNGASTNNWIHHNTIHDTQALTECGEGGDGVRIGATGTVGITNNNTIENNTFYHVGHASGDDFGNYNVWRNNVSRNEGWKPFSGIYGTATGGSSTSLVDTSTNFESEGIAVGDTINLIYNAARFGTATISNVSGNTLTFPTYSNIAFSNGDQYVISKAGCNYSPSPAGVYPGNALYGHRNFSITGDYTSGGITHILFEGNRSGYAATNPTNSGAEGLTLAARGTIVRYNDIFGNDAAGIDLKASYPPYGKENLIYNNTIFKNGQSVINGYSSPSQSAGIYQYNSTATGNKLKNNIIWDNGSGYGYWEAGSNSGVYRGTISDQTWSNNLCDSTTNELGCLNEDPLFTDTSGLFTFADIATIPDLTLQSTSKAINSGTHLTFASEAGTDSTSLVVNDASYFQAGSEPTCETSTKTSPLGSCLSAIAGDYIAIGTVSNTVQITDINYVSNTITLASAKTWEDDAPVWLYKKSDGTQVLYGSAPDIGAHESSQMGAPPSHTVTIALSGLGATLTLQGAHEITNGDYITMMATRHNGWNGAWSTSDGTNCVVSECAVPNQGATGTCSVTVNADCTVTYTATQIQVIW